MSQLLESLRRSRKSDGTESVAPDRHAHAHAVLATMGYAGARRSRMATSSLLIALAAVALAGACWITSRGAADGGSSARPLSQGRVSEAVSQLR